MPSFQVTLTSANTNYNLLTLVRAIDDEFVDHGDVSIQAAETNGGTVLTGDSALSTTRYGAELAAGMSSFYDRGHLHGLYARSSTAAQKLNLQITR
jgi:hypothetical protein